MDGTAISCSEVRKSFGETHILRGVNLALDPGERVALVGRSGAGKTTLLRILAGLLEPDSGEVCSRGEHLNHENRPVLLVQEETLLPWRRVHQNASIGRADPALAKQLLIRLGLGGKLEAWPDRLSGGERRRVELARALSRSPRVVLLDEPLSSVDALTRREIGLQIPELLTPDQAMLFSTHDLEEAVRLGHRVLVLSRRMGMIKEIRASGSDSEELQRAISTISAAIHEDAIERTE